MEEEERMQHNAEQEEEEQEEEQEEDVGSFAIGLLLTMWRSRSFLGQLRTLEILPSPTLG